MMLKAILIVTLFMVCGCSNARYGKRDMLGYEVDRFSRQVYQVYKIDSINTYYLIYAKKNDSLFKIVSEKNNEMFCSNIILNKKYFFDLYSIWNSEIIIEGVNVSPSIVPHVSCLALNDSTRVCLERDSITNLYSAKNLKGLCIERVK